MTTTHKSDKDTKSAAAREKEIEAANATKPASEQTHLEDGVELRADNTRVERPDMSAAGDIVNPAATPSALVDPSVIGPFAGPADVKEPLTRQDELDEGVGTPLTVEEQARTEALTGKRLQAPPPPEPDKKRRDRERER